MIWSLKTTTAKRLTRARLREPKVVTKLSFMFGGDIALRGEHGARVLTEIAEKWNAISFAPGGEVTRCAGDLQSQASRRKYLAQ